MVVVDYPDNTCRKFFSYDNFFFGPVDSNGNYCAFQTDLPLNGGLFEETKGIHGENGIVHSSFNGRIYYYPILADCIPMPIATYPRKLRVPVKESPFYVDLMHGFACPDFGIFASQTTSQYTHYAFKRDDSNNWEIIKLIATVAAPSKCYVYRTTLNYAGVISSTQIKFNRRIWNSIYQVTNGFNLSQAVTFDEIWGTEDKVTRWSSVSSSTVTVTLKTTDPSIVVSPTKLAQNLEVFADSLMKSEFPIPLCDYGDLAARAIKQKRTIDTNIIAFLRDIPNSKDMIPRLKNLSKLKTYAGNFLAVKYGILPTISDLSEIVGAFKERAPYLDRNGNTVYNASNVVESTSGETRYTLTQYIKVAVANEDSGFDRLYEQIDEVGLAPTGENLWDLVKYSFVLDWFVDVGGLLERLDNNQRLLRYNIPYVTMSDKRSIVGVLPQSNTLLTLGPIEWRYYHRWVQSQCPLPPLTLSTSPTVSNHWLEAGSLIIQRTK